MLHDVEVSLDWHNVEGISASFAFGRPHLIAGGAEAIADNRPDFKTLSTGID